MDPGEFFASFQKLKDEQPGVCVLVALIQESVVDQKAYIGFLRFLYVVWRALESSDARVCTQKLELKDLERNIRRTTKLMVYVSGSDDVEEINAALNPFTIDHRQAPLLLYVMGGIMTETEIFAVSLGLKYQMITWLWGVIHTFDEQMP